MGLQERQGEECLSKIQAIYHGYDVTEHCNQGYCSFTVSASLGSTSNEHSPIQRTGKIHRAFIVQIRPYQHSLDLCITSLAVEIYGRYAPRTRSLTISLPAGLKTYEMNRVPGIPYAEVQPRKKILDATEQSGQLAVIESLATFLAKAWPSATARESRADSPISDSHLFNQPLSSCRGKVGSSLASRLLYLGQELPTAELRDRALLVHHNIASMWAYPAVLNHGDLIPSNILVDPVTWQISGVVDWAEAEVLPFGTCLYGLENLLGYLDKSASRPSWVYYDCAERLRDRFYDYLFEKVPSLRAKACELKVVKDMGVLLWYGFAWDDGAIDRVVNPEDDAEEIAILEAFLKNG